MRWIILCCKIICKFSFMDCRLYSRISWILRISRNFIIRSISKIQFNAAILSPWVQIPGKIRIFQLWSIRFHTILLISWIPELQVIPRFESQNFSVNYQFLFKWTHVVTFIPFEPRTWTQKNSKTTFSFI